MTGIVLTPVHGWRWTEFRNTVRLRWPANRVPVRVVLVHCGGYAELRRLAHTDSAVDALVVAIAEPRGTVLTGDRADIEALAAHADHVNVEVI